MRTQPRHVTFAGRSHYHLAAGFATLLTLGLHLGHWPVYGFHRARDRVCLAAADPRLHHRSICRRTSPGASDESAGSDDRPLASKGCAAASQQLALEGNG